MGEIKDHPKFIDDLYLDVDCKQDYSHFVKELHPVDNRDATTRLVSSLRPSVAISHKKDDITGEIKKGLEFQIKGGIEF
jgi:hypothetical protein